MPKGEWAWAQSKRTTPPPNFKIIFNWKFQIGILLCSKGEKLVFQNWYIKTLLNTKRRFHLAGVLFSQRKSIWDRGRKISNLENTLQNLTHLPLTICKRTLKGFTKEFAKSKYVVQAWSKMLKMKETIHAHLVSIYIGSIPSNLCTYIKQTSSIMHFYICFGLCWHQSPKRGRLKGN